MSDEQYMGIFIEQGLVAEPSESMKKNLDRFVREYLVDYDSVSACGRMGYSQQFAVVNAAEFMKMPYVMRQIKATEGIDLKDDDEVNKSRREIIAALKREAHYTGPGSSHGARVAALAQLAKIADMDNNKSEMTLLGGVMLVPATATDVEQWEANARSNQEGLHKENGDRNK